MPVCGRIGGMDRTYRNACFARVAGAEIIARGPCRGSRREPGRAMRDLRLPPDRT
jgi:hypothetical protein